MLAAELRTLAAFGCIEELGARIREAIQRGQPMWPGWFRELHAHGYPTAASDLADRTVEWFEDQTSDWRQDPDQFRRYAGWLSRAGRWNEAQAVLEEVLKAAPFPSWTHSSAALELAYVLAHVLVPPTPQTASPG